MNAEQSKTAVIFSRVSSLTDRQSTTRQNQDLQFFASKNDYQVIKVFEEKISGAKRNEERSVLTECIDYCIVNKIGNILSLSAVK